MSTETPRTPVPMTADFRVFLARLDAEIAAEDREDARREAARIRAGLPESRRELRAGTGWADGGVIPGR